MVADGDGLSGFVVGVNGTRDDDSESGVWVVQGPVVGALEIAEVGVRTLGLNDLRSVAGGDSDGDGLDEVFVNTDAANHGGTETAVTWAERIRRLPYGWRQCSLNAGQDRVPPLVVRGRSRATGIVEGGATSTC